MPLPKNLFLQTVEERNVHLDVHSEEKRTGVIKPKYKLAGNRLPVGGVLFWVSTSANYGYPSHKSVRFEHPTDYDTCSAQPLRDGPSYFCIDKTDYLSDDEMYDKYKNGANGFKKVARIKNASFRQLVNLRSKIRLASNPSSLEHMTNIVLATVGSDENANDILKSMGL
ncbi:MAG: hypothetical protein LBG75_00600 [Candidatus Nomurabacteria bacterium]|jgi:hypothetical protein|nr:hypothetical protein [Candidatus Nomurabacteria bacterium]